MAETEGKKRFPLLAAYPFAAEHGLAGEAQAIRDLEIEWDRPYSATVRRGRMIELFEQHHLLDKFIATHWPYGNTVRGHAELRRCRKIKEEFAEFEESGAPNTEVEDEEHESDAFALEAHLRDFLAKNMDRVEKGLKLYEHEGVTGKEFVVDSGRIDLLGVDKNGKYVVIELKLSMGRNKTLGQLLYYMGWVDKKLGKAPCRGIIIASEISEELKVAASRAKGISLAQYRMTFSVDTLTEFSA